MSDFNSYSVEDPILMLRDAGYPEARDSTGHVDHSYQFGNAIGPLNRVLASDTTRRVVVDTGAWSISAVESPAFEYSWNSYNVE